MGSVIKGYNKIWYSFPFGGQFLPKDIGETVKIKVIIILIKQVAIEYGISHKIPINIGRIIIPQIIQPIHT